MMTWIALLRGINVAGHKKLPMNELTASLRGLGFRNIIPYLQSGNVLFDGPELEPSVLAEKIGVTLLERFGFRPRVLLLPPTRLRQTLDDNPFPELKSNDTTLHCFFLFQPPPAPDLDGLNAIRSVRERWVLKDDVFYLHAADGFGRSKLAANVEKLLGVPVTARNWRTVSTLCELADALR